MIIQTTSLVQGGLGSLEEKIDENYSKGLIVSAIASDNGDFLIVSKKSKHTEQTIRSVSSITMLNSIIDTMNKTGWAVSAITYCDSEFISVFHRDTILNGDGQPDDLSSIGHAFNGI